MRRRRRGVPPRRTLHVGGRCVLRRTRPTWPLRRTSRGRWGAASCAARGRRGRSAGRPGSPGRLRPAAYAADVAAPQDVPGSAGRCVLRRTRPTWPLRRTSRGRWGGASCGARGGHGRSAGRPGRARPCVLRRTQPRWPLCRTSCSRRCVRRPRRPVVPLRMTLRRVVAVTCPGARSRRPQDVGRPAQSPPRRASRSHREHPGPTVRAGHPQRHRLLSSRFRGAELSEVADRFMA